MSGLTLDLPGHWMQWAACGDRRDDLFFPDSTKTLQVDKAKAICRRCPVQEECLTWALETGQGVGVWGGKDERELRLIRREQQPRTVKSPPAHGSESRYRHHECRCRLCKDGHAAKQREWDQKRRSA